MARSLRVLVVLIGVACVLIGVYHFCLGVSSVPGEGGAGATVDSRERFYNAIFIGYGLAWLWAAQRRPIPAASVRWLSGVFLLGGLGRLLSLAVQGPPQWFQVVLTIVEVVLPLAFLALVGRRSGSPVARRRPRRSTSVSDVAQQRIGRAERREQLVAVGEAAFATQPYEAVQMDVVAATAGVSRALLYQHFASKRDLFAAVYQRAAERLLEVTVLDRSRPLFDQVADGLDAHVDYFLANREAVLAANRTLAGDPVIQTIVSGELAELRERVVAVADVRPEDRTLLTEVLMGWLVFVRVVCVEWLVSQGYSRQVLRDVCTQALAGALAGAGLDVG